MRKLLVCLALLAAVVTTASGCKSAGGSTCSCGH
jgi:hypothetical protein